MKILTVVGARPQFIKASVVSLEIAARHGISEVLVHTGQHFDANMAEVFFSELGMRAPDHDLGIAGGGHGQMTGRMLMALEDVVQRERPDWVLIYGDTNSTLAGALVAAKLHIPVAHVEAGLRSFNRRMPEEINRIVADHTSNLLLAPTATAVANLRQEGVPEGNIVLTGDVMYDVALHFGALAARSSRILEALRLAPRSYILATVHRQENTDDAARLAVVLSAFADSSKPVVLPLHPRTRQRISSANIPLPANVRVIDPIGYLDMAQLEKNADVIATDSGGVQKEAYFHGVPCVTLRDETEWVETVELGWNRLAPPIDAGRIIMAIRNASADDRPTQVTKPYGDGAARKKIVDSILQPPCR